MQYFGLIRQLSVNAIFWVGIAAIFFSLLVGDASLLILFVALLAANFLLLFLLKTFAPNAFQQLANSTVAGTAGAKARAKEAAAKPTRSIGFHIYPLNYPQVLDEESREYVSELIHVDVHTDEGILFNGNFNRSALSQFRDALSQALGFKHPHIGPIMQVPKPMPVTTTTNLGAGNNAKALAKPPATKKKRAKK